MTPPEEHVLELRRGALDASAGADSLARIYLKLPVLSDLLALVVLAAIVRFTAGRVDLLTGSFVLALAVMRAAAVEGSERLHLAALDEAGSIFRATFLSFATVAFATMLLPGLGDVRDSGALFAVAILAGPTLILARSFHYAAARESARRGRRARTVIVGAGAVAQELISVLDRDQSYGLEVIGAVDDDARFRGRDLGTRVLGSISSLRDILSTHKVGSVVVAFSGVTDERTMDAVREALRLDVDVWVVPRFFEMGAPMTGFDHIGRVPLVRVHSPAAARRGWRLKRMFDLVVATLGLLIAAPIMLVIALAVRLNSPGPILFRQERVGMGGRLFPIYKFRTMAVTRDSESEWSARSDRVTRVGRILRDSGLDELPQLFNVLKGDLTLVGPRPERPHYVDLFDEVYPHYSARHRVPSGITGWAQIHGLRGDTSIDERARFDNYYIENWSLSRDLKILLLTWRTWLGRYKGATEAATESAEVVCLEDRPAPEALERTP